MKLPFKPFFSNLWRTKKRFLIAGAVLLVLVLIFIPKGGQKESLQFAQVKRQDIKSGVSASGILAGKNSVVLRFKGQGKLAYLRVKQGDFVNQGDVVAGLDTQDLSITLQQAQNNLRSAQADVDKILDDIKLNRYTGDANGETQAQRQTRMDAQVKRDNAVDSVRAAQRTFQDSVIVAPISGVVTKAEPIPGQVVSPTDVITQISDNSQIYFDADIDESDISKVRLNQPAEVTLNAYPNQNLPGTVAEILPTTKTTSAGATVVTARINLQNPVINFVTGLNGDVTIIDSEAKNVLSVPLEALKDDNTVLLKQGSAIRTVKVKTGVRSDTDAEIISGLSEGQEVVINPASYAPPARNPILRLFRRV